MLDKLGASIYVQLFGRQFAVDSGMGSVPPLLTYLLLIVSGWVHRRQLIVIEFLQAENRLLKELATASAYPEKQTVRVHRALTPRPLLSEPATLAQPRQIDAFA